MPRALRDSGGGRFSSPPAAPGRWNVYRDEEDRIGLLQKRLKPGGWVDLELDVTWRRSHASSLWAHRFSSAITISLHPDDTTLKKWVEEMATRGRRPSDRDPRQSAEDNLRILD